MIRYAQQYAPSLVIAALRLALAALLLLPFVLGKRRQELTRLTRNQLLLALLSGVFLGLHFASWTASLEYVSVASSVVLVNTLPIWVVLIAHFTLGESLQRLAMVGMGIALLGMVLVGLSDSCAWVSGGFQCEALAQVVSGRAFTGNLLALLGAFMNAGYMLIGRRLRGSVSLFTYILIVYGMGALALVALLLFTDVSPLGYSPPAYLWILLITLVPQLFSHSTYNWTLRYLPAGLVSIVLLGVPVFSILWAYLLLGETPSTFKLVGAFTILAGIYLTLKSET